MSFEYKIVSGSIEHVEETVTSLFNTGWVTSGSLQVHDWNGKLLAFQPMLKHKLDITYETLPL